MKGDGRATACIGMKQAVVAAVRAAVSRYVYRSIPRILRLEPGQIWTADAFLLPEYRNRGINARFGLYTMRLLAYRGYREQIGTMNADNIAALRSSRHRGARVMYYVAYTRVFFHERLRVSTELPASLAAKLE